MFKKLSRRLLPFLIGSQIACAQQMYKRSNIGEQTPMYSNSNRSHVVGYSSGQTADSFVVRNLKSKTGTDYVDFRQTDRDLITSIK